MANSTPLVLLRGLARGQHHWMGFAEQLAAALPERQIITLDLAGNGERFAEASPSTIGAAVEDIRQQLQQQGVQGPCDVLGLSLGGMITLHWQHSYPDEIQQSIIINSSHAGLSGTFERMLPGAMLNLLCALFLPVQQREKQVYMITSDKGYRQDVVAEWTDLAWKHPVSHRNFIRQVQAARSFKTDLQLPADKVLILASDNDHMVSNRCSRKLAERLGCEIVFNGVAGHDLPLDEADWCVDRVCAFLNA